MARKSIASVAVLLCLAGLVAGCGSQGASPTASGAADAKSKQPVKISFWFPSESKVNDDYFTNAAKEFEKLHPDIQVETTALPGNAGDIDVKLNAAQMSGTYPDVMSAYLVTVSSRGPRGEFYNMKPLVDQWADKSDIYQSSFDAGMLQGKLNGLGFYPAPEILTYRKDYFKEAGLDPSKPPTNWTELADDARKLAKRDASGNVTRAGLDIPAINAPVFWYIFMRQNGSLIADENKQVPSFTDEGAVGALNYIAGLVKDKVSIPYDSSKQDQMPFLKGNSAMAYLTEAQISNMIKADPSMKDKLGYAPVIQGKVKSAFSGTRLFTMGAKTKYPQQSWEFVQFLMSKDQMLQRSKELNIPVVRKSLEQDFIAEDPELNKAVLDYVQYGKGAVAVPWASLVNKYVDVAYQEVYSGKKTAEQALKDADANLEKDIQNMK